MAAKANRRLYIDEEGAAQQGIGSPAPAHKVDRAAAAAAEATGKSDWDYDSDEEPATADGGDEEEEGEFPLLPDLPPAMKELVRCMLQHGVEPQGALDMELVVSGDGDALILRHHLLCCPLTPTPGIGQGG